MPNNVRVNDATGEYFQIGNTVQNPQSELFWMGGTAIDHHAADGSRINLMHISPTTADPHLVVVAPDTAGDYFYTGHSWGNQHWVKMYTNDGLLVGTGGIGPDNGSHGGWIDHGMGLTAFTHPNGTHYVYAEEVRVSAEHPLPRG